MQSSELSGNAVRKTARKRFSRIGFSLVAYIVAAYLIALGLQFLLLFVRPELLASPTARLLVSEVGMHFLGVLVCFLIVWKMPHSAPLKVDFGKEATFCTFFIAMFFVYVFNIVGNLVGVLFFDMTGIALENTTIDLIEQLPLPLVFLFVVVIGPLAEEFVFRKLMIDRLRTYGEKLAILYSALAFGFFHCNLYQFFYAAALGLLFGYVYMRCGKLWLNWLLHALINFFGSIPAILLLRYTDYAELMEIAGTADPLAVIRFLCEHPMACVFVFANSMIMIAFSIAGFIFFVKRVKRVHFYPAEEDLPRDSEGVTAFANVGTVLFILLCVAIPLLNYALTAGLIPLPLN